MLYDPADGSKKLQNVWTRQNIEQNEIEYRKNIVGVDTSREKREALHSRGPESAYAEYMKKSTPGKGSIIFDEDYSKSGHGDEVSFANWLFEVFGGEIRVLSESEVEGEKRPDFQWNGLLWDLKKRPPQNPRIAL